MSKALAFMGAFVFVPALAFAQQPCTTDAARVVNEIYRHVLERGADPGSQDWVNHLVNRRMSVKEVVRAVAVSQEHMQRFGQGNSREAVANMYRHILGRQPDEAGLNSWTQVAANRGMNAIVDQFINSAEYNQNFGDWGVVGSGGLRFCANGEVTAAPPAQNSNQANNNNRGMRFRGMDANNDGTIARNEWRGNVRAFRVHDWNSDGVLSGDEVRVGAREPDFDDVDDFDANNENRFEYLDANNNGRVDQNEWDGSNQAFARLDRNGDGRLTRAELGTGTINFQTLDSNDDDRIALDEWRWSRRAFETQDDDGDGYLSRREYRDGAVPTTGRQQDRRQPGRWEPNR